ncbi:MAG: cation:proton antiporter [Kiritimatiellae bacterium]|nr:cation:proton antiporter [Kiritimatiellia bacterium]
MKKASAYILFLVLGVGTAWGSTEGVAGGQTITHHMMLLMIQLGVIIFCAKFGSLLFKRLHMPGVLGELCVGMLIGPYLLGKVPLPGFPEGLFQVVNGFPVSLELYGICSLAAIILLFMVGLETDLKLFLRFSVAGTAVGVGGVVASFVLGDLCMVLLDDLVFGKQYGFFDAPSLFLGVVSTATSVGITARILSERKKLSSPEGVTILAGAVVDDVLGIIMLAVVLGAITASQATGVINWGHIGVIAGKAVGIWLISTMLGLLFARRISILLKLFRDRVSIAIMALGLALILSGLFEEAGLAMIIGAYVAGLSLSQTDISRVIREKLEPVQSLLVPVFFCCMGMMVNFTSLSSPKIILFGLFYSLVAVMAKILGCSLPALFFRFNLRGALRVGVGMVPRGEVALIIAGIGLAMGVLRAEEFGVAIIMTLLTTVAAPLVLVQLFKNPASGTSREVVTEDRHTFEFKFPSLELTELMFSKLLVAFEKDGFFVHALEHDGADIYQLRQDDMAIELRHAGTSVFFDCEKQDEHMVNSAVFEISSDLRTMLDGLSKPIDPGAIQKKMTESAKIERKHSLSLAGYIPEDCIEPNLKATTKEGVIEELLDMLVAHNHIRNKAEVFQALLDREKLVPTGLQDGFAMPHAKTDQVNNVVCAVGIKREGLDFSALDGQPSRIFVMELAPQQASGPHLQFVSAITQIVQIVGHDLVEKNLTPSEIHQLLTS